MSDGILTQKSMPYCPGCGHKTVTKSFGNAVAKLGLNPLDVIVVSDIGCCGLIDGLLNCHTVHGLHGRAVALAMGVRFGLGAGKKVVAIQGDGGATIGLQHLLEAARRNVDITLIVQNNLVYGMTGGQVSGLSPHDFKDVPAAVGEHVRPYDICALANRAGASFAARTFVGEDTTDLWLEALGTEGFSLIEIVEVCSGHGIKKLKELQAAAEYPSTTLREKRSCVPVQPRQAASLFDGLEAVTPRFDSKLTEPVGVVIAGSAGEAVQSAGQFLTKAGMLAGLHTTKKGEYPITVATGFSIAEVILSPKPIRYSAIDHPHTVIAVSENGLRQVSSRIDDHTHLVIDETLSELASPRHFVAGPFRKRAGAKGAALAATAYWLRTTGLLDPDSLLESIRGHRRADRLREAIESVADVD